MDLLTNGKLKMNVQATMGLSEVAKAHTIMVILSRPTESHSLTFGFRKTISTVEKSVNCVFMCIVMKYDLK